MKKILISILLFFFSIQLSFAGSCWGNFYYIYENQQGKIFYIWQYSFENIFWDFPVFQVQDLTKKGVHYTVYISDHCAYEWFEELEKWTFFDYSFGDKLRILWNLSSIIIFLKIFMFLLSKRKKSFILTKEKSFRLTK